VPIASDLVSHDFFLGMGEFIAPFMETVSSVFRTPAGVM